ncbi:MAG: S8 family peptidase [bacterium]
MAAETADTESQISEARKAAGVDPFRLLVLEFDSVTLDLHDDLEKRFAVVVVDEKRRQNEDGDRFRYIVQFPDQEALNRFREEVAHYQNEDQAFFAMPHAARRDFFDALQHIGAVSSSDRRGRRLCEEGFPDAETFYLDVDLWHPGNTDSAQFVRDQIRSVCQNLDGHWRDAVHTRSLILGKVRGNRALCEQLLNLDWVARVDLPAQLSDGYLGIFRDPTPLNQERVPDDRDGLACVIDSGTIAGHPLLSNWVIAERDFDSGEGTPVDLNGHGTSVSGLVVYGDIASCIEADRWVPRVRICNAKVLRHDEVFGRVVFPEENRIEEVIEQAIRHFHGEHGCRVFNISVGDDREVYTGGRQFPLAEKLDELARELDIVVVIAAGNRGDLPIPEATSTREELQSAVRDQLLHDERQRVCNPATASLALTVGAIARSEAVMNSVAAVPGSPPDAPSPFTRIGPGYAPNGTASAIKPDLVAYGGNCAIETVAGDEPRWSQNVWLGEPTIRPERDGRILTGQCGTSFAAPHVTHAAACIEQSLTQALSRVPSANAIRAILGTGICPADFQVQWLADESERLRACGYGVLDLRRALWSVERDVCLPAEDRLEENHLHIYRVGVPEDFLEKRGRRGITAALAYDPPVRASRRDYLGRTITIDVLHGLTEDEVETYRAHRPGESPPRLPGRNDLTPEPARTKLERSTLQVRSKSWTRRPRIRANGEGGSAIIHVLVMCRQRFPTGEDPQQSYALAVRFWHEDDSAQIHAQLRARVRTVSRVRV